MSTEYMEREREKDRMRERSQSANQMMRKRVKDDGEALTANMGNNIAH